jgi:hypothetical protein
MDTFFVGILDTLHDGFTSSESSTNLVSRIYSHPSHLLFS